MTFGICAVLTNSFVVVVMMKYKRKLFKFMSIYFLFHQSILDIFTGLSAISSAAIWDSIFNVRFKRLPDDDIFHQYIVCKLYIVDTVFYLFNSVSIYNIILLTMERYLKIVYPNVYELRIAKHIIRQSFALIWCFNILTMTAVYVYFGDVKKDGQCHFKYSTDISATILTTSLTITHFILPLFIFIFCYIKIWIALKLHNAIHTTQPNTVSGVRSTIALQAVSATLDEQGAYYQRTSFRNTQQKKIKEMEKNIMTTLVTVSLAFFTTWMFSFMINILVATNIIQNYSTEVNLLNLSFITLGSCLNAFIYAAKFKIFKRCAKHFLGIN